MERFLVTTCTHALMRWAGAATWGYNPNTNLKVVLQTSHVTVLGTRSQRSEADLRTAVCEAIFILIATGIQVNLYAKKSGHHY